jgi:hypothetical protein
MFLLKLFLSIHVKIRKLFELQFTGGSGSGSGSGSGVTAIADTQTLVLRV